MKNGKNSLKSTINNLKEATNLDVKLCRTPSLVGEIAGGIKIYHRPVPGSVIACITISPESNQPIIFVDDLFFTLTPKCMKFVLLHEVGHYVLNHFIPMTGKEAKLEARRKLIANLKREYPRKEQDADYYAMYKMDSVQDAKDALIEINEAVEKIYERVSDRKLKTKGLKHVKRLHKRRLIALENYAIAGPYYINEGHNPANDISDIQINNSSEETLDNHAQASILGNLNIPKETDK